jgi:hypothetical protein
MAHTDVARLTVDMVIAAFQHVGSTLAKDIKGTQNKRTS